MAQVPAPTANPHAERADPPGRTLKAQAIGLAALAVLAVAVFYQSAGFEFVRYDDDIYVYQNPQVMQGLGAETLRWAWSGPHYGNYNPLTWMSHLLDVSLFGLAPAGHHLHNVLLHLANVVLLFWIAGRRLRLGIAWLVAAALAVHPQHVESVAWVSDRKDLLAALWGLLATIAYGRWAIGRKPLDLGLAGLAFVASLLSKSALATLPLFWLLLDAWPLGRWRGGALAWRQNTGLLLEKAPFLLLSGLAALVTAQAQAQLGALVTDQDLPLRFRLGNAVVSVATFAAKTLWPSGLAVHYPHPGLKIEVWWVLLCALALIGVSAIAWRLRRNFPEVALGWFGYLLLVAPVAGVVQLGSAARADRFCYVPLIPLTLAGFSAGHALLQRLGAKLAVQRAVAAASVVAQAAVALAILPAWRDTETLMRRAVAVTEANAIAQFDLGMALERRGESHAAWAHYQLAYQANPLESRVNNKLGNLAMAAGQSANAANFYKVAYAGDPADLGLLANLTIALELAGRIPEAETALRQLLGKRPQDGAALTRLGNLLLRQKRASEALANYQAALALEPNSAELLDAVGNAQWLQGRKEEALSHWQKALAANPPVKLRAVLQEKLRKAGGAGSLER